MPDNSVNEYQRPVIVCLCGSTRFGDAFRDAMREETLAGKIVLTVGVLGHVERLYMDGPVKKMLDELHLRKIDLADAVLILNEKVPFCRKCNEFRNRPRGCSKGHRFDGTLKPYIGESTARELAYAKAKGKVVRFLHPEV